MENSPTTLAPGHAFISYIRDDAAEIDRLQSALTAAGIRVWRDTDDLWPGQDWRQEIKNAIKDGSFVFLACFSEHTDARETSYQNEELILAVEQMRLRKPGQSWLLPLRFSECKVPSYDLGAGRDLNNLQRIDLFGERRETNMARLVSTIIGLLNQKPTQVKPAVVSAPQPLSRTQMLKSMLLASERQIELEDLVNDTMNDVRGKLLDPMEFPSNSERITSDLNGYRYLVEQARRYERTVEPLVEILVPGCQWGRAEHDGLWARVIQQVANTDALRGGNTALLSMQQYPLILVLYAAGLAAVHRKNFRALKAITVDAQYRREGRRGPIIGWAHTGRAFGDANLVPNVLAIEDDGPALDDKALQDLLSGAKGKRFTPVSDHAYTLLRPRFADTIADDNEYAETFDELEIFFWLIASDHAIVEAAADRYASGPWRGRFTWRHTGLPIVSRLHEELKERKENWLPIQAGLFGGSVARAEAAFEHFEERAMRRYE